MLTVQLCWQSLRKVHKSLYTNFNELKKSFKKGATTIMVHIKLILKMTYTSLLVSKVFLPLIFLDVMHNDLYDLQRKAQKQRRKYPGRGSSLG